MDIYFVFTHVKSVETEGYSIEEVGQKGFLRLMCRSFSMGQ